MYTYTHFHIWFRQKKNPFWTLKKKKSFSVGEKSVPGACSWCIAFFSVANVYLRILTTVKNLLDDALQNALFRISQARLYMNKKAFWTHNEIRRISCQLLQKQEKIFENYFWKHQTHNADSDNRSGDKRYIEFRGKYQKSKLTCFCSRKKCLPTAIFQLKCLWQRKQYFWPAKQHF